ncbi:MAG: oligosaccharide flippase family protein, partial [Immundisolibacteraceae bacterium]|nr:oligosaccharide flippase family protein [Immundisolibacteraceae bacterium]
MLHKTNKPKSQGTSPFGTDDLGKKLFQNTATLAIGRNLSALGRLASIALIVRGFGVDIFGEYALIIAVLTIADWVLDFGTSDLFIRELVADPAQRNKLFQLLFATKLIQTPIAMVLMILAMFAMDYELHVIQAGAVAAIGLSAFSLVVVYQAVFRATLTVAKGVAAEPFSVVILVPAIFAVEHYNLGLIGLLSAYTLSRAVYFVGCYLLGRSDDPLSFTEITKEDLLNFIRLATPIGGIGFLVVFNDALELLSLSALSNTTDVAYYSAAQRLIWPVLMALTAVGATFYPVLGTHWRESKHK